MYHHQTYRYTVTAEYGGGCGSSVVALVPTRPVGPTAYVSQRPGGYVELYWEMHGALGTPEARSTGALAFGPGLPAEGYEQDWRDCEPNLNGYRICVRDLFAPSGDNTWIVVPYWETENGRMIDVSSGSRVTAKVP
jgi:hypothetical protein